VYDVDDRRPMAVMRHRATVGPTAAAFFKRRFFADPQLARLFQM
jgi:hypothetical protein